MTLPIRSHKWTVTGSNPVVSISHKKWRSIAFIF
nr:MAG TPA: hypothetical protein [Caudoviricetes sp.]